MRGKGRRLLPFHEKSLNPIDYIGIFRKEAYQTWLPISAYLIEHHKGLVLIDAGWHTDVRTNQTEHLGWLHHLINKARLPAEQAINEQQQQRGIKSKDIDFVVMSHLHSDHVSGTQLLKDVKRILVSELKIINTKKNRMGFNPSLCDGSGLIRLSLKNRNIGMKNYHLTCLATTASFLSIPRDIHAA